MPTSEQFGNLLVASTFEEAALTTLQTWFPTYLHEIERQLGLATDTVKPPVYYTNRNSFDASAGEPLPKVVAISPGLLGQPLVSGKHYRATWRLGIGVAMAAKDEVTANMLVKIYGAAVRGIMLQKQSLGGTPGIQQIVWIDETYDDLPIQDQINLYKAAGVYFTVDVEDVVSKWMGPTTPDQPTYPDYGQVEAVIIDLQKEPIA